MQMIITKQMAFQSKARPYHRAEKLSCQKIELERDKSIDKQITPAKTRYRRIQKYNLKKTKKMGNKEFGLCRKKWFNV